MQRLKSEVSGFHEASILLKVDIAQLQKEKNALESQRSTIESSISELCNNKVELKQSITALKEKLSALQKSLAVANEHYEATISKQGEDILVLDAKKLRLAQELGEQQRRELATRSELASMQRILDERDRNLRIREAKVEMGEERLIQNNSLLNL